MLLDNVIELINNTPDYSWIGNITTIIVTMLTIFFTNKNTKKAILLEIDSYKKTQLIDSNKKTLELAAQLLRINDYNNKQKEKLIKELIECIMAYGSNESVKILANFQQFNYKPDSEKPDYLKHKVLVYPALLICQIKYEINDVVVSPLDILRININDIEVDDRIVYIKQYINETIDELKLSSDFKVK